MHFELLGDEKKSMTRLIFTSPRHLGAVSLYTSLLVHICLLYGLFLKHPYPPQAKLFWRSFISRLKKQDFADTFENSLISFVAIDVLDTTCPTPDKEKPERFQKLHPKRPSPHEVLAQRNKDWLSSS
jgi:hypothetical protein